MLVTGMGAEDSMEMMTTNTSGLDGGQSHANVNKTLRLCLSNTVTGNTLPATEKQTVNDAKKVKKKQKQKNSAINGFDLNANIKSGHWTSI